MVYAWLRNKPHGDLAMLRHKVEYVQPHHVRLAGEIARVRFGSSPRRGTVLKFARQRAQVSRKAAKTLYAAAYHSPCANVKKHRKAYPGA